MAGITLLEVVTTVAQEVGIPAPASVANSSSMQIAQLVAFANWLGDWLRDEFDWPVLRKQSSITTVASQVDYTVGDATFPCTRIISNTGWDSSNRWFFAGAISDQEWAAWNYSVNTMPIRKIWRTTGDDTIEVYPSPDAGDVLQLTYKTSSWARSAAGAGKSSMSLDDDYHVYNDRLFLVGLKRKWKMEKGLPYAGDEAEWQSILPKRKAAASPGMVIQMDGPRPGPHFLDWRNVPDSGYGV